MDPRDVPGRLGEIATPPDADSLSAFIEREATLDQVREFVMHRSAYQLKEADPHLGDPASGRSREDGRLEIQYDEYGSGDPAWHSELFRTTMIAAGLDGSYGAYVDRLPGRPRDREPDHAVRCTADGEEPSSATSRRSR